MIEINNLVKYYGAKCALDNISLEMPTESVYAIVGPNGAGKSTLLKILAGILPKDSGVVDIDGISDKKNCKEQLAICLNSVVCMIRSVYMIN